MAPDQRHIFAATYDTNEVLSVDTATGHVTVLATVSEGRTFGSGIAVVPTVPADSDGDADVDLLDQKAWGLCALGPQQLLEVSACSALDMDRDGDADLGDWAAFQRTLGHAK